MKRFSIISSIVCIITLLTGLILPGCSSESTATKELTVAIVTPLTSPAASVATSYERAVEMAIADQNAKGGVTIDGQKYTLKSIVRDDKFDAATAKSIADEVVLSLKIPIIFGPSQVEGPAIMQTTNDNKVLMFHMSPTTDMTSPQYPYNFALGGIVSQQYATVLEYITKFYPEAKKVVTFYADLSDAPLYEAQAPAMCEYYNLQWLGMEKFATSTTDFSPFAQKLLTYNADVIDIAGGGGATGALMGTVVKSIREAGFTGIIMMPTVPPYGTMDVIPKQYLNKIVTNDIDVNAEIVSEKYKDIVNRYHDQYSEWPIDFFAQAYNGASAFFTFLDGQKDMDTTRWMNEFAEYKWKGVFDEDAQWVGAPEFGINRCLMTNFWTSEWKDGVLVTNYVNNLPTELWISE